MFPRPGPLALQLILTPEASQLELSGGILFMMRFALYLGGVSAALVTWIIAGNRIRASRPVPAKQAAAMLRQAWADHHTEA